MGLIGFHGRFPGETDIPDQGLQDDMYGVKAIIDSMSSNGTIGI
jgi:hypothetical protein